LKVLRTVAEVREHRARSGSTALVPTMGSLHEGHLELMRQARGRADTVTVSIFVNPLQFGAGEDFAAYPRDEERDLTLAESVGVDAVFAPSVEGMYGARDVVVRVGGVSEPWEGERRPGHFEGVATVVAKLFNIVTPDVAVFGLKDLQQCAVVRAMVEGLDMGVRLEFVETVRDENGLALSSRNAYFTDAQRVEAAFLYRALRSCAELVRHDVTAVDSCVGAACGGLRERGFEVEYLACVDPATMRACTDLDKGLRLICAAKFHGVRLIDNVPV
jgi:pantoate--beta-alanine ligase